MPIALTLVTLNRGTKLGEVSIARLLYHGRGYGRIGLSNFVMISLFMILSKVLFTLSEIRGRLLSSTLMATSVVASWGSIMVMGV